MKPLNKKAIFETESLDLWHMREGNQNIFSSEREIEDREGKSHMPGIVMHKPPDSMSHQT